MKTRQGFVSNSSSSSFVVNAKERHVYTDPKTILTPEDMNRLREYGFMEIDDEDKTPLEFLYDVTCNQDDVIEFLLKNSIPFEAACHYGHYNVFYYPDKDLIVEAWNYGAEISTYGPDMIIDDYFNDLAPEDRKEGIKKFTRKEYLERYN